MPFIISTNGKRTKVSRRDYSFLSQWNWHCDKRGYFQCTKRGVWKDTLIHGKYLHWFVMQLKGIEVPKGFSTDHKDRDKSNNTRSNLRLATPQTQQYNTGLSSVNKSGYKGVHFEKGGQRQKRWRAQIRLIDGKIKVLGIYRTPIEASKVYAEAVRLR